MLPVLGVCFLAILLFILFLVLWFRSKERDLTQNRLVLTRAFPTEATVAEIKELYHPHIRDKMYNYNPSLFVYRKKRYLVHRLSTYHMCSNILKHIPQFKATFERGGTLNSIVIQTPLDHMIFVDYPQTTDFPCPEAYEDPRSILFGENLVLIVNNAQHEKCQRTMVALFLRLDDVNDLECASLLRPHKVLELTYEKSRPIEKNWMPFVRHDELYFVYSVNPHVVLRCDTETGQCVEVAKTRYDKKEVPTYLRGGTPCLPLGDQFLTVGHARHSIAGVKFVYTSVFYLFESDPPFRIIALSPEFFLDDDFEPHKFKQIIQFVSGMVLDDKDGRLYVSYGVGDCQSKVLSLPLESVLSLLNVRPKPLS